MKRLEKFKGKFNKVEDMVKIKHCEEAFTMTMEMCEDSQSFDANEIRDIFYDFFISMFKSYDKYFGFNTKKNSGISIEKLVFNKELFLNENNSTDVTLY